VHHDRTAWCCAVFVGKRYGSKGYLQRNAAHVRWTLPVTSSSPLKHLSWGTLSWRWRGEKSSVRVVPTATTRILRRRFPGTCETVGQVFKFVWRLRWKINAVCMLLSPFVSFRSLFVTYLLTYPRNQANHNLRPISHVNRLWEKQLTLRKEVQENFCLKAILIWCEFNKV